jgi:hypothetical protein
MKLVYTISCNKDKDIIIKRYPRFQQYFADVEHSILENPYASSEETILFHGKHIHVRKRAVKTTFFSGLLRDQYLYLTLTYALTTDDKIVILLLNLRTYID